MYTTNAIITDVIVDQTKIWIQLSFENIFFPAHYEFDTRKLADLLKIIFLIGTTKSGNVEGLRGKQVRIIDIEKGQNSLVAIGSTKKNKFIDLYGSEFPVSEKILYRRYRKKL